MKDNETSKPHILQRLLLGISLLGAIIVFYGYLSQSDSFAALTLWPIWSWAIVGILLILPARHKLLNKDWVIVFFIWILIILVFSEEPLSLSRYIIRGNPYKTQTERSPNTLRIISLNCAGEISATEEVIPLKPDIVLLQEVTNEKMVKPLAMKLFGEAGAYAIGPDCAVIIKGTINKVELTNDEKIPFTYTLANIEGLPPIFITSLRLTPVLFREDLWSPSTWYQHKSVRLIRKGQLRPMANRLNELPKDAYVIFGGDFNAPAGDAIFRLLDKRYVDTFKSAGRGLSGSVLNEYPVARIDQLWTSGQFTPLCVYHKKTKNSDHRMVICDVKVN